MRLISWNVNGLRACLGKGFIESMRELEPDFICIQETKMQEGQAEVDLPELWNGDFCERKTIGDTKKLWGSSR